MASVDALVVPAEATRATVRVTFSMPIRDVEFLPAERTLRVAPPEPKEVASAP